MTKNPTISKSPLRRLFEYADRYRLQIWQASICSILNKIFDLAPPVLIGAAVDVVVNEQDSFIARWGIENVQTQLIVLSIISGIIWGLESLFEYIYKLLWRNLAQTIQHELRLDAYRHLQKLELSYFEERSTGSLMAILNDDINQLERFLDVGANEILQVVTTILIVGGGFFIISPEVAWLAMLPMPFIVGGSILFQKRLAPRYAEVREKVGFLNGQLSNNLTGITTIKSFTAEEYEAERIGKQSQGYRLANRRAIAFSAAFIPMIRFLIFFGFTATLIVGGLQTIEGRLAVGSYSVLVFITQRLLWPLTRLGETFDQYQRAMASTNRVMNLLDTPIATHPGNITLKSQEVRGEIDIKNITFSYNPQMPVMKNLSLYIPAGDTIAIVGATGSGKSTLVKLLLRLYEIQSGTILIDGIELQQIKLEDLRKAIGLVSQDVFLFHGTVAENIAYGTFDASFEEIVNAAKVAEADGFINGFPLGYDTIVGERGQKLSGGQRQRIAIARAVLKNPPILILDEATSAVDNETEAAIQRSLEYITQNRTTIAIAHRLSTIRNADCIYVMEDGQLVEWGRHEELLEKQGVYNGLWRVQSGLRLSK
ncbi:ABC transporter ATP-binding protein [Arthrospira platensis]|uniref:ABC transporter ATP-binding protein n=1 Tax=Limnospira platensis NIES-46 TaxID=1236695 RepID=A0A5M3T822_LIMPL|nr:ABC transporter ATP-binding protein [Arthrospira platensis]AMW28828.1 ABC transporter [Arthrospira platensis YZ]MBD2572299.1 ABC transporter ATP-binding protein [Arthrospira platensis FACHB-971]MBD2668330.1 ABC transporter ATP-binding protein [Arthrospira platensis FACHB-439]MBD2709524.1 ABC transporter ATP-binding protein [Arthrospira platensis FACHB-835]MDF2210293.1 ABC transporter ATP-binding protein [Arthrospira platensis NCB002]MDT9181832.1 ABC transporter ATP-binding protein [Limnosp